MFNDLKCRDWRFLSEYHHAVASTVSATGKPQLVLGS